jgi:hypothetical protein
VGDIVHLQEFVLPDVFTGREVEKRISYILDDPRYCKEGYVILGLADRW